MNPWEKIYGARRRAIDRRLLASMEREIAQAERAQASRTAAAPDPVSMTPNEPKPAHEPPGAFQARIAAAFGRPLTPPARSPTYK
jgi:hypothetical protein